MIYPVTMYAARCDGCGKEVRLMGEYAAFAEKECVEDDLRDSEYKFDGDKHYCSDCWSYDDNDNLIFKQQKQ
jgi:hypothetical protein